jgi:hypothetical protein
MTLHNALFAISLGESPPLDPVTGKAFIWDPATRTLSPPSGDIDPLVMPPPP